MKIRIISLNNFLFINGALCLIFFLVFKPVMINDASAYIELAKQIFKIPGAADFDLSHRSPLYSILLGILMILFGQNNFTLPLVFLQYLMVFFTSFYIYRIFIILTGNDKIAFFAGLFSTLNLSTIYFAYNILSEILSMFIFTLLVYQVLLYYKDGRKLNIIVAGGLSGLIVLARFNALGVPLVLLILVLIIHFSREGFDKFRKISAEVAIVIIIPLFVLNLWAVFNYQNKGLYNIFPSQHYGQRWAIPSTINENNKVSDQNEEILQIFLTAKKILDNENRIQKLRQGTLLDIPVIKKAYDFFKPSTDGFQLYKLAVPELLSYFNLLYSSENISLLGEKLKPFYKEIAIQNKRGLLKLKAFSFLYTFKYVSPILPSDMPLNLNKLPDLIIKMYKFLFLFCSVYAFIMSLIHVLRIIIRNEIIIKFNWLILYALIWYFPVINCFANVLTDANRFKFPAESLILGLGIYYFYDAILFMKHKISLF